MSAPNFAKRKRMEQAEDSSPDPSSSACEIQISRGFAKSFPPENSFGKTESALFRHTARILGGQNTKEKCPFHFQEKFHPRQIKKARDIFLWCCRVKRGSGGTILAYDLVSSHHARGAGALVRLLFEKGSSKVYDYSTWALSSPIAKQSLLRGRQLVEEKSYGI